MHQKKKKNSFTETETAEVEEEHFYTEIKHTSSTWMKALGPDARARGTSVPCSYK